MLTYGDPLGPQVLCVGGIDEPVGAASEAGDLEEAKAARPFHFPASGSTPEKPLEPTGRPAMIPQPGFGAFLI